MSMQIKEIIALALPDAEYQMNGVRYLVSSKFEKTDYEKFGNTITNRLEKYIASDFSDLNICAEDGTMITGNVIAGEEA